jgi:transcription-repair coupling factor (superfamily II helicase)
VDVFSPAHPLPARLTLDGDRVESIRWFDPATQRTRAEGASVVVLPCSQVVTREEYVRGAAGLPGDRGESLRQGIRFHGVDAILPRLYGCVSSIFDYLPPGGIVAAVDSVSCLAAARNAFAEAEENFELSGRDAGLPGPEQLFLPPDELVRAVAVAPLVAFDAIETPPFGRRDAVRGEIDARGNEDIRRSTVVSASEGLLLPLVTEAKAWWKRGARFVVTSLSPSQADRLEELLSRYPLPLSSGAALKDSLEGGQGVSICCSEVIRGFRLPELSVAVVTEAEIFGGKTRARRSRKETAAPAEEFSLRELRVNDLAVHVDHGVGIYRGLLRRRAAGVEGDFLVLEYAAGDRLFVPVEKLARVQRYVASEEAHPKLARLGGTAWQRAKARVRDSLLAMAQELIALYARREIATRPPNTPPDAVYREFEAGFAHEETPDQQRAIEEVLADLASPKPMDRLICGDVG